MQPRNVKLEIISSDQHTRLNNNHIPHRGRLPGRRTNHSSQNPVRSPKPPLGCRVREVAPVSGQRVSQAPKIDKKDRDHEVSRVVEPITIRVRPSQAKDSRLPTKRQKEL